MERFLEKRCQVLTAGSFGLRKIWILYNTGSNEKRQLLATGIACRKKEHFVCQYTNNKHPPSPKHPHRVIVINFAMQEEEKLINFHKTHFD